MSRRHPGPRVFPIEWLIAVALLLVAFVSEALHSHPRGIGPDVRRILGGVSWTALIAVFLTLAVAAVRRWRSHR